VYRDEADLDLLAELAGVLDQTVTAAGLSSGTYLILRELCGREDAVRVTDLAGGMGAGPEEVADLCGRLVRAGLAETRASGVAATGEGRAMLVGVEDAANEAMRAYVVDRPHSATVYGLVASMQSGRFTVEDLLAFLAEGPGAGDPEA
jgi:hypothetical protein